jgi:DHA3 family macrolide efflux protein-like MFS transporter
MLTAERSRPTGLAAFYAIVTTQTLSLIGSRMTSIAVGIWVFNDTGRTAPLLLTAFFLELPGMLGSSVAGVWVDRWDRRRVLMLSDAGQALGTLLLLVSFWSGQFQLWHLYAIALLQGSFATFQGPAKDAVTTLLVPERHRERANGVQQMAFPLAGVVAPVLAGTAYAVVGISGIILIDLTSFVVAVLALVAVRIPRPRPTEEGSAARGRMLQELRAGLRFLRGRVPLWYFVLYLTFITFLLNGPLELAIPYLIAVTGSAAAAGSLIGFGSLGALAGAGLIAVWGGTRPRTRTLLPGLLLTGLMFLVYAIARTPLLLGVSMFLLFLPLPLSWALFTSIVQIKTPPDMQGRVFGLLAQLGFLASTTSFLLTGPVVDRVLEPAVGSPAWHLFAPLFGQAPGAGMGLLLFVTGLTILGATFAVLAWPRVRRLEATLPDYDAPAAN